MIFFRKIKILVLLLSTLFFFSSFLIISIEAAPFVWNISVVDASADVGFYSSLALDSNNYPVISHYDHLHAELWIRRWTGSTWVSQLLDANGGEYSSLALGFNGIVCVSYGDGTNTKLMYTTKDGPTILTSVVDATGTGGLHTSLALDSNDEPHISYYDGAPNYNLKYAFWDGSAWNVSTIDSAGDVGTYTSIALDSNNNPHISYYDSSNHNLKYATRNGAWSIHTLDSIGDVGLYSAIAIATNNHPHICYRDETNNNLKYVRWTGTRWVVETVDASADVGTYCSLALCSLNRPHISYRDEYFDNLKYAHWNGQRWNIKNVESFGDQGKFTSIALDSHENPHISYQGGAYNALKYAQDPDETIIHSPAGLLDVDNDGLDSGIEIFVNADTTYAGTVNVTVIGRIFDDLGSLIFQNKSSWEIHGAQVEYSIVSLYLPEDASPGLYDVAIELWDERNATEDGAWVLEDHHFYPPGYGCSETGQVIGPVLFDSDGDENNDALKFSMDVDTSYSGSLDVRVDAWLFDPEDNLCDSNSTSWTISGFEEEWNELSLYAPVGYPEGNYRVGLQIYDEWGNRETYYSWSEIYVQPPQQFGRLEGRVTDIDTGEPIGEVWIIAVSDIYQSTSAASGHYGFALPAGEYSVMTEDYEYGTETVLVTIVNDVTTVQDFALQRTQWSLIIQVDGSGSTDPWGGFTNPVDSELEVTASPDPGWTFSHWDLDGENIGSTNPITIVFDSHHTLTAVFEELADFGWVEGTITEFGAGLPIEGVSVSIISETLGFGVSTRTNASGYYQSGLPVGDFNVIAESQHFETQEELVNISSGSTVTQNFVLNRSTWELYIGTTGLGTVDPISGSRVYQPDASVQVEATPQEGWILDYWIFDSEYHEPVTPFSVVMDAHHALFAVFSETSSLMRTLEIEASGSGTTEPGFGVYLYPDGAEVLVDALPQDGWMLSHWMLEEVNVGFDDPVFITMNTSQGLAAIFTEIPPLQYHLTLNVSGAGSTSIPLGVNGPYGGGDNIVVEAQPDEGWEFDYWLLDSVNVGNTTSYTVIMNDDHGLTAVFRELSRGGIDPVIWILLLLVAVTVAAIIIMRRKRFPLNWSQTS